MVRGLFIVCGAQAELLHGMWDLPGPEKEHVFPALAGKFSTAGPPGKSCISENFQAGGISGFSSVC